jgi:hypothetical protein
MSSGYRLGRDAAVEDRVDLRASEGDETSALDVELERALRRSKENMDRVVAKADRLRRELRRPDSYPQIRAALTKEKLGA